MKKTDITVLDDFQDFKDLVLMPLGDCLVEVELEDTHISNAYHRAKQTYLKRGNLSYARRYLTFPTVKEQREYELPAEPVINTAIKFIRSRSGWGNTNDPMYISIIEEVFGRGHGSDGDRSMMLFDLSMQRMEILERYSTFQVDFIHDPWENKIYLNQQPKRDEDWILECFIDPGDTQLMDMLWVQEYTSAELKHILGTAYNKFSSIGTPAGDVQMNGKDLIQEAKDDKKRLLEEIENMVDSGHPTGGTILLG